MKKTNFPFLIIGGVIAWILISLIGCTKTASSLKYSMGWNSDHTYMLKVRGVWDRDSYYIDGEKDKIADFGKIPVSAFELKRQAETFARTRAIFTFQDEIEDYFIDILKKEVKAEVEEEVEFEEEDLNKDDVDEGPPQSADTSSVTSADPTQLFFDSDEPSEVFDDNPSQRDIDDISPDQDLEMVIEEPEEPQLVEEDQATTPPSYSHIKKTINFREVYDKVDLKITLLEKTYTENNDVDIIYLFSGKNLKQELANAFNISNGLIELRK